VVKHAGWTLTPAGDYQEGTQALVGMDLLVLLLPTLSLVSALLTYLVGDSRGRSVWKISLSASVLTFLCAAVLLGYSLYGEAPQLYRSGSVWGSLLFDPLSILMSLVIAGISLLVRLYSVRYMVEEKGYGRFFMLLDLMTASLIVMVAAGDLISLLIAWHLVGVLLYFLLGHDTRSHSAYRYGFWTFITYRFGDLPLLLAAVLLFHAFGTWSLPDIFAAVAQNPDAATVGNLPLVEVVGALVALSAFARSAQFFLHTWLPYSMEGPTPVSALMHAGIVNAGGFLLNRFAPIYIYTGDVLHWVFIVGLVTAVTGSVLMLSQNDIKKSLGYSTMGQMGFMIMETGLGAFSLAIFHLIAHGLFKGTLFLNAGSVINEARKDDGVPKNELYTFIVTRQLPGNRQPWLLMAAITLVVPLAVLFLSHIAVAPDLFQRQGAIILLFFGWVTGAQLLFSAYHMNAHSPWRLVALLIVSFVVVVIGYTLISHAFDLFLFPDAAFAARLFAAADIDIAMFDTLMILTMAVIVIGWLRVYYNHRDASHKRDRPGEWWMNFYALVSREFHIADIYTALSRGLIGASARINNWLRWG
jgi:NADH-quinone oxidoreductase subunit L